MTAPNTLPYESLVLEVETTPGSGTYVPLCGLDAYTITRALETSSQNVPADCSDNSKPHVVVRRGVAVSMTVTGTGATTKEAREGMPRWLHAGTTLNAQVRAKTVTTAGNVQAERGAAFLTQFENAPDPGNAVVTASITVEFTGAITLVNAPAE